MSGPRFDDSGRIVLVTGGSGFLGSHLCRALVAGHAEVHAVSRRARADADGIRWWNGDLAECATAYQLLDTIRPDLVFHLTTHGSGAPELQHVLPSLRNDVAATVNLLTAAAELGTGRIVTTGSLEEPGQDTDPVPSSPYAAAKQACSLYGRMFYRLYRTPLVIARIFMTYGPGQPDQKVIPHVIRSLLQGRSPRLADGRRLVDWIYVDDVIAGLLAVAHAPGVEGQTIDLGSGVLVSVREVVERIEALTGAAVRPTFGALPPRPMMGPERAADVEESFRKSGWTPQVSLTEGLTRTVRWHRAALGTALAGTGAESRYNATAPRNDDERS